MNTFRKLVIISLGVLISTIITSKDIQAIKSVKDNTNNHVHTYDCSCNISIKVKDIRLKKGYLSLGEIYNGVAIVTLEVKNNDIVDLELSNIDIYPYQNDTLTKCFVTTAEGDINGMVGYLKSGEKSDVKIGVALSDLENPLELEFISADENQGYRISECINLDNKSITMSDF